MRLRPALRRCATALLDAAALARPEPRRLPLPASPTPARAPVTDERRLATHVVVASPSSSTDYAASFRSLTEAAAERSGLRPNLGRIVCLCPVRAPDRLGPAPSTR